MAGLAKIHRSLGNTNKAEELFKKYYLFEMKILIKLYYNACTV